MKLYIAGPMTGRINYNFYNFFEAEKKIKKIFKCEVINPAFEALKLCHNLDKNLDQINYAAYFDMNMENLKKCDAIYMLKDWEKSGGATKEFFYATKNKYHIFFEAEAYIKSSLEK